MSEKIIPLEESSQHKAPKGRKSYFGEVKKEFGRISWTKKEELKKSTKVVVGSIFFFGFATYFADLLIRFTVRGLDVLILRWFG